MENNVFIQDPQKIERIKEAIKKDGVSNFHILADFDQTLTKAFVNGELIPSLLYVLYNKNYLTPDYSAKAQALHHKYYKIEMDPNLSKGAKKKSMEEWWNLHFKLLVNSKLNRKDIRAVVKLRKLRLRDGFGLFSDILERNNIPLVIMSSSGLGGEAIADVLKLEGKNLKNIFIAANVFIWDKKGNAVAIKRPIIHAMNKGEACLKNFPAIFKEIKNRKNILLLGNSPDDSLMAEGFAYSNLIKLGFLNEKIEENLEKYKKLYDIVITNDGSMNYVNKLLKEWCK